jgi:hypothetical protein
MLGKPECKKTEKQSFVEAILNSKILCGLNYVLTASVGMTKYTPYCVAYESNCYNLAGSPVPIVIVEFLPCIVTLNENLIKEISNLAVKYGYVLLAIDFKYQRLYFQHKDC